MRIIYLILAAFLGGFLFGLDIGSMTGSVLLIQGEFSTSSGQMGLIVGSSLLGSMAGALISPLLSTYLGRRSLIAIGTFLFAAFAFGLFFSTTFIPLYFYRAAIGIAIGITAFAIPLYVAELAPKAHRGSLVSLYQLSITLGVLGAFFAGYLHADTLLWRPLFLYNGTLALLFLLLLPLFPVSPKKISEEPSPGWETLRKFKTPLLVGLGVAFFQQATGINGIIFFAPSILHKTGIDSQAGRLMLTACIGLANSLSTILCMGIIDRVGRRSLLLTGLSGMAVALGFLAWGGDALTGLIFYMVFFAVGIGPLFWVLCSEIFPLPVRSVGMSLATLVNWITNFSVSSTFLLLVDHLELQGTFLLYGVVTLGAIYFVKRSVPETKGRSLESIESLWALEGVKSP